MAEAMGTIALGWLAFAVAAVSPGPNLVAVASHSLGTGRAAGHRVAVGIAFGAFLWALLSVSGLSRLLDRFPAVLPLMSLVGGGYLCWLGLKGLRSAWNGTPSVIASAAGRGGYSDLIHGLSVTLSNPKAALLWASLATLVGPAVREPATAVLFATGSAALGYAIYGAYGMLFSSNGVRGLYASFARSADGVFGFLFLALGLSLMFRFS